MIRSLAIRNFTIIERLDIEFGAGFGAITGETGAGKSILIDALSQLLGDRGDASLVAEGADKADLTAVFDVPDEHAARDWLRAQELEDDELVLRRVIPASGSSRAWINGQPATIGQLRDLGTLLVEIHGQHEHQRIGDASRQRAWLDRAVDEGVLASVRERAEAHAAEDRALAELDAAFGDPSDLELTRYQWRELEELDPGEDEFAELEAEHRRLASVDELQHAFAQALDALDGESASAGGLVLQAFRALSEVADREPGLADVLEMLETARVNLDEAGAAVTRLAESVENDPERLRRVEDRLSRSISLARKHGVEPSELPALRRRLAARIDGVEAYETRRAEIVERLDAARRSWRDAALALHRARREAAAGIGERLIQALGELGMQDARVAFEIEFDDEATVSPSGADRVELRFSANPGQSPRPVGRVASGGELSRLSLAMIIAGAGDESGRVRIFDEIDAGVGGEVAHAVGRFLKRAGDGGQAFCVTHLAQVAACADQQFSVRKIAADERTTVDVSRLAREDRVRELARMLGSADAETSLRHAGAMLDAAC